MTFVRAHYQRQTNESTLPSEDGAEDAVSVRSDSNVQEEFQFIDHNPSVIVSTSPNSCCGLHTCLNKMRHGWNKFLLGVLGFLAAIGLFLFLRERSACSNIENNSVCLTPRCIEISANILSSMDRTADPCDDFYKYACGNWELSNPIPDGKSSWSPFEKLHEANQLVLKNILFSEKNVVMSEAEDKTRKYFYSCFDEEGVIERNKAESLRKIINQDFGGWELFNTSNNISEFNFEEQMYALQNKYHFGGFFLWSIVEDEKNSSRYVIQIDQGGLSLPTRDFYVNEKESNKRVIKSLEIMMVRIFRLLLEEERPNQPITKEDEEVIKRTVHDIVLFEKEIANITISSSERKQENNLYNKLTLEQLNLTYPFMNWASYFNRAFEQINRTIPDDEVIIVYSPKFFGHLTDLIEKRLITDTGRQSLNNYMIWQVIRGMKSTLSKAYRDTGLILQKALFGKEGHEERWRFCISDTDNVFGYALGAMFVRKTFHGKSKTVAEGMITLIKEAFVGNLRKLKWMDETTKNRAIDKANSITDMIGYPDYILRAEDLNKKYTRLNVTESDYFQNALLHSQFVFEESLKKLFETINTTQWSMTPPTVNAYYTPTKNQIVFPSGLLQNPFFDVNYPKSLNFGAMGVVMGHELSHAFDDEGRKYDKHGNMVDWWLNMTTKNFKDKLICMTQQYSHYTLHNESVDGNITVGENIADNGGLKASYRAFVKWLEGNKSPEIKLPGINLTNRQLFFVAFSQVWCSSTTKETDHLQLMEDHHSPGKFRVLGPLSNFREFSKVFNCPVESKMNPKARCEIW